jgi:hypothetical protein
MAADSSKREAGSEWRAIAQKSGTREFAAAFTANPVLETSVLNGPLVGTAAVDVFFIATAHGMYDSLRFTTETNDGRKIYLEWEGRSVWQGRRRDDHPCARRDGPHRKHPPLPRPLQVVLEFSKELALRLKGKTDPNLLGASG